MKKYLLLLLVFTGLSSFTVMHKFYVSVTEIEYNEKVQSLQIISRVFIDDFEDLLKKRYDKDLRLGKKVETSNVSQHINKYLKQKLELTVDGKPVAFELLGKEYDNDMLVLYIEVPEVKFFKNITVRNTILMDLFPEQKNLVHVEHKGKTKSLILADGLEEDSLNF